MGNVGRPPKYKSKEEMEEKIEQYFKDCEGHPLTDDKGNQVYNKLGHPVIVDKRPPTVTGLALALGFNTRLSLLNYQGKKEFMNTITRAKIKTGPAAHNSACGTISRVGIQSNRIIKTHLRNWTKC